MALPRQTELNSNNKTQTFTAGYEGSALVLFRRVVRGNILEARIGIKEGHGMQLSAGRAIRKWPMCRK